MRLEFHPEAELESVEAAVYYEKQAPGLGERFESEIRYATDLLLDQPEFGSPADPDLRKFILIRFLSPCTTVSQPIFYDRGCRTPKPPSRLLEVESYELIEKEVMLAQE